MSRLSQPCCTLNGWGRAPTTTCSMSEVSRARLGAASLLSERGGTYMPPTSPPIRHRKGRVSQSPNASDMRSGGVMKAPASSAVHENGLSLTTSFRSVRAAPTRHGTLSSVARRATGGRARGFEQPARVEVRHGRKWGIRLARSSGISLTMRPSSFRQSLLVNLVTAGPPRRGSRTSRAASRSPA